MRLVARHLLSVFLLVLVILLLCVELAQAQKRSGGSFGKGSGSWGKGSSSGKPSGSGSPSRSGGGSSGSGSSSSSPSKSTSSSWGSRPPAPVIKPKNATEADEKAYQKSVQTNTFGKSSGYRNDTEAREAAFTDFRKQHAQNYPSVFKEQPQTRPEWIPEKTSVDGREVPVSWRNNGYYYYHDRLGQWMLYDMMADSMMRDRYMYRHGYDPSGRRYVHQSPSISWVWVGALMLLVVVGVVGMYYYYSWSGSRATAAIRRGDKHSVRPPPRREEPMRTKHDAGYWDRLKPGDNVNLKDQQTLELLMQGRVKDFTLGADLTVKSVKRIVEQNELMRWTLAEMTGIPLKDAESAWYLLVKIVDDAFDVRLLFVPSDFQPGNRADLVARDNTWLFAPPANPQNFKPEELEIARSIDFMPPDGRPIVYERKSQGILFGSMTENPKPSGIKEPQFVSVLEFRANGDCPNPELLILEIGGLIVLMQGTNLSPNDVEVLPS